MSKEKNILYSMTQLPVHREVSKRHIHEIYRYPPLKLTGDWNVVKKRVYHHAKIQKILSKGSNFDNVFFFSFYFSWWREGVSKYHYKRAIIGPPAKRHLNGVSLACR